MNSESDVWRKVRDNLPCKVMAKRIEDSSGDLGTWDTWIGCHGWGAWIELKWTATVNTKPKLRPGQYAFGVRLQKSNVMGIYLCGSTDGKMRAISMTWDGEEDWKEKLIDQWDQFGKREMLVVLRYLGLDL